MRASQIRKAPADYEADEVGEIVSISLSLFHERPAAAATTEFIRIRFRAERGRDIEYGCICVHCLRARARRKKLQRACEDSRDEAYKARERVRRIKVLGRSSGN